VVSKAVQTSCCGGAQSNSRVQDAVDASDVRTAVREHYGKAAAEFQPQQPSCCGGAESKSHVRELYEAPDALDLPEEVSGLSMGCGDPITLAALQPGQTVLDLGSGGGIDCFLAAKRVGESGHVIGVDMTAEMIEKARLNKQRMGFPNVEFRLGEIEHIPASDSSVDVIISNCVINLSPDKPQVLREAYRVLKPGGRLAVSDIVTDGPLPQAIKDSLSAWAGCIAGALDVHDFQLLLEEAGFADIHIIPQYWDEKMVAEAINEVKADVEKEGKPVLVINEGAEAKVIPAEALEIEPKALVKSIFSARISAVRPAAK
jgi:arsenite methyltransferase